MPDRELQVELKNLSDFAVIEYTPPQGSTPEAWAWIGPKDALVACTDEFLEDVDPGIWARVPYKLEKVNYNSEARLTFFRRVEG
jgi:hypothetical protein